MPTDDEIMKRSAHLSALAILIHTAIEDINPAASGEEYYNCEPLDCVSGLKVALDSGWIGSKATQNKDGTWNDLFLVKLTPAGRTKVDELLTVGNISTNISTSYSYIRRRLT
jgi:hypothetical protein